MARKKNPIAIIRTVTTHEQYIQFTVADGIKGTFHMWQISWDEMERFCRKNGSSRPLGDLPRGVSHGVRHMMETDPEPEEPA